MPTLRLCPQWKAETPPVISRAFKASWGSCSGPLWIEVPGQRGPRATVPVTSNDSIHPWLITPWTHCDCTAPLPSSSPLALQFAWGLVPFDRQGTEPLFMNHHLCASYAAKCRTGIISLGLCISSVRWAPSSQVGTLEAWKMVPNLPEATEFISRRNQGLHPRLWLQSARCGHSKTQVGTFLKIQVPGPA